SMVPDDLFIVGINGSNKERIRKVIWAGKLSEVMTFAEAYRRLKEGRFRKLRGDEHSPLHVSPVERDGNLVGYDHRSNEHIEGDQWISDLMLGRRKIRPQGRRLILQTGATSWEFFDRD